MLGEPAAAIVSAPQAPPCVVNVPVPVPVSTVTSKLPVAPLVPPTRTKYVVPLCRLAVTREPSAQASSLQPIEPSAPHGPASTSSAVSNVRVAVQVENVCGAVTVAV